MAVLKVNLQYNPSNHAIGLLAAGRAARLPNEPAAQAVLVELVTAWQGNRLLGLVLGSVFARCERVHANDARLVTEATHRVSRLCHRDNGVNSRGVPGGALRAAAHDTRRDLEHVSPMKAIHGDRESRSSEPGTGDDAKHHR